MILKNGARVKMNEDFHILKVQLLPSLVSYISGRRKKSVVFNGKKITRITKPRSQIFLGIWPTE